MKNLELEPTPAEDPEDDIRWWSSNVHESVLANSAKHLADLLAYNETVGENLSWSCYTGNDAFLRKMSRVLNDYSS